MKIKQTILALTLLIGIYGLFIVPIASAATCGGITTSILSCDVQNGSGVCPDGSIKTKAEIDSNVKCTDGSHPRVAIEDTGIWGILLLTINILSVGVGVTALGGVVYGSILYTTAGGSPDQVKKARTIIGNVIVGILAYALMFSFLNYIIPGGLFKP